MHNNVPKKINAKLFVAACSEFNQFYIRTSFSGRGCIKGVLWSCTWASTL